MIHALLLAAATTLTPAQIDGVLAKTEQAFSVYPFPAVAKQAVATLKARTPQYEKLNDPKAFQSAINHDLAAVTHDKHVHVAYPFHEELNAHDEPTAAERAHEHRSEEEANFGFFTVRRLPGNVGYIDFRYFSDDADVGKTIAATMSFLAGTDALIIDLRHNGGGSPIAAQTLEAYFFAQQQQITSIRLRDPKTGKIVEHQQWTAPTVPGPLYTGKPIYLLTSDYTFSCAEQFTYDLHNLHRVTIVGATTGGGANPGDIHALGSAFAIFMPEGYAYSDVTKTNWEGTGIAPDVAVPAASALTKAYALALVEVSSKTHDGDLRKEAQEALKDESKALAP